MLYGHHTRFVVGREALSTALLGRRQAVIRLYWGAALRGNLAWWTLEKVGLCEDFSHNLCVLVNRHGCCRVGRNVEVGHLGWA